MAAQNESEKSEDIFCGDFVCVDRGHLFQITVDDHHLKLTLKEKANKKKPLWDCFFCRKSNDEEDNSVSFNGSNERLFLFKVKIDWWENVFEVNIF